MDECEQPRAIQSPGGVLANKSVTLSQKLQRERSDLQNKLDEIDDVLKKLDENPQLAGVLNSLSRLDHRL